MLMEGAASEIRRRVTSPIRMRAPKVTPRASAAANGSDGVSTDANSTPRNSAESVRMLYDRDSARTLIP